MAQYDDKLLDGQGLKEVLSLLKNENGQSLKVIDADGLNANILLRDGIYYNCICDGVSSKDFKNRNYLVVKKSENTNNDGYYVVEQTLYHQWSGHPIYKRLLLIMFDTDHPDGQIQDIDGWWETKFQQINIQQKTYNNATVNSDGLMSSEDKEKLDNIGDINILKNHTPFRSYPQTVNPDEAIETGVYWSYITDIGSGQLFVQKAYESDAEYYNGVTEGRYIIYQKFINQSVKKERYGTYNKGEIKFNSWV